jgi:hypothetical protein
LTFEVRPKSKSICTEFIGGRVGFGRLSPNGADT